MDLSMVMATVKQPNTPHFCICHSHTSFLWTAFRNPSHTVWISISQLTGTAANKEDSLQRIRSQRQTFHKNKNHALYKTHPRA